MQGEIQIRKNEGHVLRRAQWTAIATTQPELVDPPPRMGINPSNGKPFEMAPAPDYRAMKIGNEFVGFFEWSTYVHMGNEWGDDLGVVAVFWVQEYEEQVKEMAARFATEMGADFVVG